MKPDRWDPLDPEQSHAPADGSDGVVVGDDTGILPRVRVKRCWPWRIIAAVLLLAGLLTLVLMLAVPVAGSSTDPTPTRSLPACRCGSRAT